MAILAKCNQILRIIILLVNGESLPVPVDMVNVKPVSATTKLTFATIALKNLWIAPIALLGLFISPFAAAVVTGCPAFAIVGISWVNGLSAETTQVMSPAIKDSMTAFSFLQQIIGVFFLIAFLTIGAVLARRINATARTKTVFYSPVAICLDFVKTLATINHARLGGFSTAITKSFCNFCLSPFFHLVKAGATMNPPRIRDASTSRTLSSGLSSGASLTISFPAIHILPPGHIVHQKGWFVK